MSQHKAAARVQGDRAVYAPRLENAAVHRRTAAPRRTLYYVRDVSQRYEKLALKRTDGTTQSNATQGGGGAAALNRARTCRAGSCFPSAIGRSKGRLTESIPHSLV